MNSMRAPELDMRRDQIMSILTYMYIYFFFFNDTATTEIYTLSLHDALPISPFPSEDTTPPVTKIYFGAIRVARVLTPRSEEHTSELQSRPHLVCRLLLEKNKDLTTRNSTTWHTHPRRMLPVLLDDDCIDRHT